VALPSKAQTCSCSVAGIAGSNPAEGKDVRDFRCVLCRERPLRRADHSFRGVLPCVGVDVGVDVGVGVCECVCEIGTRTVRRPSPDQGCWATENKWCL